MRRTPSGCGLAGVLLIGWENATHLGWVEAQEASWFVACAQSGNR